MADLEKWWASTVILRVNWPAPRTFNPSPSFLTTPNSTNRSALKESPASFSSRPRLTMAYCFLKIFVNPRLGNRRWMGIWPPSKPRLMLNPVPACWPLWPRVEVLPRPEPIPRPMRLRGLVCPAGGFNPLRFISLISPQCAGGTASRGPLLHHFQQVRHLLDHAAELLRVRPLHHLVEFAQTQPSYHPLVMFGRANGAADEFDLDRSGHVRASPPPGRAFRPRRFFRAAIPARRWLPSPRYAGCGGQWTW